MFPSIAVVRPKKIDPMDSVRLRKVKCSVRFSHTFFLFYTAEKRENVDFSFSFFNFAYLYVCL